MEQELSQPNSTQLNIESQHNGPNYITQLNIGFTCTQLNIEPEKNGVRPSNSTQLNIDSEQSSSNSTQLDIESDQNSSNTTQLNIKSEQSSSNATQLDIESEQSGSNSTQQYIKLDNMMRQVQLQQEKLSRANHELSEVLILLFDKYKFPF